MSNEKPTSDNQQGHAPLAGVGQRTFLFSGWYAGEKFEIKIKAVDRESAIADFETTWVHHKWNMTQEID